MTTDMFCRNLSERVAASGTDQRLETIAGCLATLPL